LDRDLSELHTTVNKACEILHRTRDGDDLEPSDLKLTELAVNGHLNDKGIKVFDDLYGRVVTGKYKKPWLHGVEPMTRDHEGFIFYKDKQVEHFSGFYVNSLEAKRHLTELRSQCAYMERNGMEVSCANVVWGWEKHRDAYGKEKQAELDRALAGGGITFSKVVIDNNWNTEIEFYRRGTPDWEEIRNGPEFADLYNNHDRDHGFEVSVQSYHYGDTQESESPEALAVIPSCYVYLRANGLLETVKSQNFMLEPEHDEEMEDEAGDGYGGMGDDADDGMGEDTEDEDLEDEQ